MVLRRDAPGVASVRGARDARCSTSRLILPRTCWRRSRGARRDSSQVVGRILPDDGTELVLVVDQLEEVFTMVEDEQLRNRFLRSLVAATQATRRPAPGDRHAPRGLLRPPAHRPRARGADADADGDRRAAHAGGAGARDRRPGGPGRGRAGAGTRGGDGRGRVGATRARSRSSSTRLRSCSRRGEGTR